MGFKRIRGLNVSYARQGQIYFALANYSSLPHKTRQGVDRLLRAAAAEGGTEAEVYEKALRAWLLEDVGWNKTVETYRVSERQLLAKRKWIYEHW